MTEAQKKAIKTYQAKMSSISVRIKKEDYQKIKNSVEKSGISLREFVLCAIKEKIEREGL